VNIGNMDLHTPVGTSSSCSSGNVETEDVVPAVGIRTADDPNGHLWVSPSAPLLGERLGNIMTSSEQYRRGSYTRAEPTLGVLAICAIAYFNVCGGPWGSEAVISSVGPLPGLVGAIVFSVGWGLPLSLVTAELSSVFPDDGGYSIWVSEAFGEFWGFQESYWSWVSGVIDNAIYPVLAYESLIKLLDDDIFSLDDGDEYFSLGTAYMVKLTIAFAFTFPNLVTIREFGPGLSFLAMFVFLPFLVLSFNALFLHGKELNFANLLEVKHDARFGDWADLINLLYWNFSGFDCVSTCAGSVCRPSQSYPRGLLLALVLITLTYMLPLVASVAINDPEWEYWDEGSFVTIAESLVGHWLAVWMVVASFAGNAGMHIAEMFEDSWQLCGMAEVGLAPSVFAYKHPHFKTPLISVMFSFVIIAGLIVNKFAFIVGISNFFSVASALLELSAFLKLRHSKSSLHRPFEVPIQSNAGLGLFILFPFAVGLIVLLSSFGNTLKSISLNISALLFGVPLFFLMKYHGTIKYTRGRI